MQAVDLIRPRVATLPCQRNQSISCGRVDQFCFVLHGGLWSPYRFVIYNIERKHGLRSMIFYDTKVIPECDFFCRSEKKSAKSFLDIFQESTFCNMELSMSINFEV